VSNKKPYNGKILRVDLTKGEVKTEVLDEIIYRKYLGGSSLASYFLLKELKKGVDPLGPDNMLVFTCSVVTGTTVPGASRFTAAAKSPLTGGFAEAEAGGWFAPELKWAGFDAIIIKGVSPKPVYLWINNDKVELRDAQYLTGKDTGEVEHIIRDELKDEKIRIAQIGPAGEKMVRYANIGNECEHFNGRVGLGAVMGSKKLRAIAVRGTQKANYDDPEKIKEITKEFASKWKETSQGMYDYGTAGGVVGLSEAGILPTRNFREGQFEGASAISGVTMADTILVKRGHCYACPVRCKREVKVEGKYDVDPYYGGPEYETVGALGSLCGIDDLEAIAKGNELCARYGLDTISTGTSIAFAMECFEEGIIDKNDTDGIELKFGHAKAMLEMIEKIKNLEGIGAILAQGVAHAAKEFGSGAERFAMHVKGEECPMHEPRGKVGVGLQYAISPTGADHMEVPHDLMFTDYGAPLDAVKPLGLLEPLDSLDLSSKKVRFSSYTQKVWSLCNCICICMFIAAPMGSLSLKNIVDLTQAVTGWETSLFELLKVAEKSNTMARCFNIREGLTSKDDKLPDRFFEAFTSGPLKDKAIDKEEFEKAIKTYYAMQGWDENGVPTKEKLAELDLDWIEF
jgi:aldehyde:ferredoxin oxidoreductase